MQKLVLPINRILLFFLMLFSAFAISAWAQMQSTIRISVGDGVTFRVDGQQYITAANFIWPTGSKHILQYTGDQTSIDASTRYGFGGCVDNQGLSIPGGDPVLTITADPKLTSITCTSKIQYKVILTFFASSTANPTCDGAPGAISPSEFRPGLVYVNSTCYSSNAIIWVDQHSTITLSAIPYPGFVFVGWSANLGPPDAYLRTYVVNGPVTIAPQFAPAKRVRFFTSPPELQLIIDRTVTPTRAPNTALGCASNLSLPNGGQLTIPTLCFGDFDFLPGSQHLIAGVSPQNDKYGKSWLFDKWSNGGGQNYTYVTGTTVAPPDALTANFVPGAQVSFVTNPTGLMLSVDDRQNWPAYNFVWAMGTAHQVSPIAEQTGANGRRYRFRSWSNNGPASQTINVDQSAVDSSITLVANFDLLSRVVVQTSPPGLTVQADGASCQSPCNLDRVYGSQVRIGAPSSVPTGDGERLDLTGWSDGNAADHSITVNGDIQTITANYTAFYRLNIASDPAGSVKFRLDPLSPDMFYPANTTVNVTADASPGYKFRRWDYDLSGTYPIGTVTMTGPHAILARLDKIPYIAPAGVKNAAGDTPDAAVAPGSLVSIFGENLAPDVLFGRANPLAQTLLGVSVTVNDQILPLIFVSPQQINAQLPSGLSEGDYQVVVHSDGLPDLTGSFTVARNAPGILNRIVDSKQYAVASHEDGTPITLESPARPGEAITVLGTGFGPYDRRIIDGFLSSDPQPSVLDPVEVLVGDSKPAVMLAGAAPGYAGVTATKFRISPDMAKGLAPELTITVNGKRSNTVLLPIQ